MYFLSHRQTDTYGALIAEKIFYEMKERVIQCWMDVHVARNKRDLPGMKDGIKNSRKVIVVLSKTYFESDYCKKELQWAMEEKKPIILVMDAKLKVEIKGNLSKLFEKCPTHLRAIKDLVYIFLQRNCEEWKNGMEQILSDSGRRLELVWDKELWDALISDARHGWVFKKFSDVEIADILAKFKLRETEKDETIIEKDDDGDFLYVIKTGKCTVMRPDETQVTLSTDGKRVFGEVAIIFPEEKRNATVKTFECCKLWYISKEDFQNSSFNTIFSGRQNKRRKSVM